MKALRASHSDPLPDAGRVRYSLLAGVMAAVLWSMADMLLVGFVPTPHAYPLFSQLLASKVNTDLALLMLDGSPARLSWGVYLATFSVVLYVCALYGIARLLPSHWVGRLAVLLLLVGYVLSPLGHAGFAYVGLQAQSMLASSGEALAAQVTALNQFEHLLNVHWLASVSASALGWLLVLWLTLAGRTSQPRLAALLNPVLLAPLIGLACLPFSGSLLAVMVGCASLNLAQLVFFLGNALWMFLDMN